MMRKLLATCLFVVLFSATTSAEERFADLVGNVQVQDVKWDGKSPLYVPFITWGGESATFLANGGLKTEPNSIYGQMGLNLDLHNGDDFVQQVRDYMSGKTPFLRGTFRMVGMASEVIGQDPRTQGVVFMQLTWSAGDHIVARDKIRTISDLRGTVGCLQIGGPHVGLVDDVLKSANLDWKDLKDIRWMKDLSDPAKIFRNNPDVDWCAVITPDMAGLTGGLQNIGSGAEGTVQGAHVLVSTAELSRSIADVYVCRKDFYNKHRGIIEKFVAGYMKGAKEVLDIKKQWESKGSAKYDQLLSMMQNIFGEATIPTPEEDGHGMILDCTFVGLPGNVAFFSEPNNLNGFDAFMKNALQLVISRGYASKEERLLPADLDLNRVASIAGLSEVKVVRRERFNAEAVQKEIEAFNSGNLDDRTIYAFTITFQPNQVNFPTSQYEKEFNKVVELASKYGNAVVAIRGHSDPSQTLMEMVRAGMKSGALKRSGTKPDYRYSLNGKPFTIDRTDEVIDMINKGCFDNVDGHNPRETMTAALNLSRRRAENVRDSIIQYAEGAQLHIDKSQIQPQGVGIREPFIAKPTDYDQALQNMRVEFRLIRVDAEVMQPSSDTFDF